MLLNISLYLNYILTLYVNHFELHFLYERCFTNKVYYNIIIIFSWVHVPSVNMEKAGLMTCSKTSHQGMMTRIWLDFLESSCCWSLYIVCGVNTTLTYHELSKIVNRFANSYLFTQTPSLQPLSYSWGDYWSLAGTCFTRTNNQTFSKVKFQVNKQKCTQVKVHSLFYLSKSKSVLSNIF